ncbi:ATP-binding cassette domain-containing protein [Yoonia sp.]|uniref:thiamine ABC transporter ATP-binding protein n=1 Tax=Yoonia sp. TaxID=2212373 RepID=UPI0023988431|nr:ATP-binding cassette domain-containing protein [Yoonia sp.]MDE0850608.1 ATP-binding cassette domain-containing protein [Yoonia sp.]
MLTFEKVTLAQGTFRLSADFAVPGGVTAVIGPSGSGKSTLLAAIAGFLEPVTGRVLWNGEILTGRPPGQRPVSMLFQDNNLFPHLTIAQNVGLGVRPDLKLSELQWQTVEKALSQVDLAGLGSRKPGALSGGQQSRGALARVLVSDRPLVLLDEPFAALGPALKTEMLKLVQDILVAAGKSVMIVTHDPSDAQSVADQVVLVVDGQAMAPIPTRDIFENPPEALRAYLG